MELMRGNRKRRGKVGARRGQGHREAEAHTMKSLSMRVGRAVSEWAVSEWVVSRQHEMCEVNLN